MLFELELELEPTNVGNYVLLVEIYAEGEDVKRVKKLLEEKGLQIVPDAAGLMVYSIRSLDKLNPQIKIHGLVVKLLEEMMEQWYVPEIKAVLYELDTEEKQRVLLGHSEKLQ
ncbi:pentatricopeptide repeat-containing protein At3g46790, chloroplastic-like [Salvia splendens]|nr:pentatricopeptide repeat-containing protein At3g46790, chloroplastic-like [Salvia splendens]